MRQEMKVGFAIGGVLLAVLVVYVLVVSNHDKKTDQVTLDKGEPGVSFQADHADQASKTETGKTDAAKPSESAPKELFKPDALAKPPTTQESTAVASANGNDPWSSALSTGKVPTLYSQTPIAKTTAEPVGNLKLDQKRDKVSDARISSDPVTPTTAPSNSDGARTHTVAAGETFSSIASAVYGNASFYPHILRANPQVDPKKLKIGTVLEIPPLDSKIDDIATKGATKTVAGDFTPKKPIDEKTQYVVLAGDSLYRISVKLYGKPDHIDKIADVNKGEIGAERRLKIGQILALPEAPTATR